MRKLVAVPVLVLGGVIGVTLLACGVLFARLSVGRRQWGGLGAVLLVVLAGCAVARVTPLGTGAPRPAVPAEQVAVYRTPSAVPGPYEEVALIALRDDPTSAFGVVMSQLKKKAGSLGANAVLLVPRDGQTGQLDQAVAIFVRR